MADPPGQSKSPLLPDCEVYRVSTPQIGVVGLPPVDVVGEAPPTVPCPAQKPVCPQQQCRGAGGGCTGGSVWHCWRWVLWLQFAWASCLASRHWAPPPHWAPPLLPPLLAGALVWLGSRLGAEEGWALVSGWVPPFPSVCARYPYQRWWSWLQVAVARKLTGHWPAPQPAESQGSAQKPGWPAAHHGRYCFVCATLVLGMAVRVRRGQEAAGLLLPSW